MSEQITLYERIGGRETVDRLIWRFYDRVLADTELAPFFRDTSMDRLRNIQREFFAAALDGPQIYSGLALSHVHQGMGIKRRHFSRFVGHLLETLKGLELSEKDIDDVVARIATYSGDVLGEVGATG